MNAQNAETTPHTSGKYKQGEQTNPQPNSSDAQNATTHSENTHKLCAFESKGKIIKVCFELEKLGYSKAYLETMLRALMFLANRMNLDNSSDVSIFIARGKWASSYKGNLCDFYQHYVKYNGLAWNKPKYRRDHKILVVPKEEKVNLMLGHASRKYALIYSIIKECGLRPIEVANLTLRDIDLEKGTVSVYSAKYGNPRILKLKPHTQCMLVEHVKRHSFNLNDRIFLKSSTISNTFERLRTSLAKKMHDSELKRIRLYDLRHYYASMLY